MGVGLKRAPGPPAWVPPPRSCFCSPARGACPGRVGDGALSLADRPDRQTALQRALGAGRPATSLSRSGRRQLARPAGCPNEPHTIFFTPYFSNKKAVRLQPQPSGRQAPKPPGSTATFPPAVGCPEQDLGAAWQSMWGIMCRGSHMFWGGEGSLKPGAWAAPRAGPGPSEGKAVERFSICLSECQPQGLGWSLIVLYLGGTMSLLCLHLEPEAEPKADEEGQVGWQEPGWGQGWEGQVHLASDTGANWPGEMGPGPSYRPPSCLP